MNPTTPPHATDDAAVDYDVVIVGGGPVGTLLACQLGARNLRVLLLEKRTELPAHSMAIGITPPSLQILAKLNLTDAFVSQGVQVRDCFLHGQSGLLGCVSFREIPCEHRFILSLQQSATVSLLQRKLGKFSSVTCRSGVEATDVWQKEDRATVTYHAGTSTVAQTASARYVIACDGARSTLRKRSGISTSGREYGCHFVMGDFNDQSGLGDETHLFFTAAGSVESFPLPRGQRRWIVQTDNRLREIPAALIAETVLQRVGIALLPHEQVNQSAFTPHWFNSATYHTGRMVLCGDAAHGMSPIGGQGMNTGFADAEFLADILTAVLQRGATPEPLLEAYSRYRRKAAQSAIRRADWGMWLGTWRGLAASRLRDFILRHLLCQGPLARHMGPFYAMLTIPYNTLDRVPPLQIHTGLA